MPTSELATISAKRLNVPQDKVYINLDKFGNTSTATIPTAFDETVGTERTKKGDLILMVGFGAGFTWGGALIRWQ